MPKGPQTRVCESCGYTQPTVMYDRDQKRWICHRCWQLSTPRPDPDKDSGCRGR
jgi:recombinational DNA repair protein (RecF pathway)